MFTMNKPLNVNRIQDMQILLRRDHKFPKTGIMATIGPACFPVMDKKAQESIDVRMAKGRELVRRMIDNGMNMARINLAHVKSSEDRENAISFLDTLSDVVKETGYPITVTVDLAGPKIRIRSIREKTNSSPNRYESKEIVNILRDEKIRITQREPNERSLDEEYIVELETEGTTFSVNALIVERTENRKVSMDDGNFQPEIIDFDDDDIICIARDSWTLRRNKGVNFPGCPLANGALTKKDLQDLDWLFNYPNGKGRDKIDYVSVSFVKLPSDITIVKGILKGAFQEQVGVIAKIETSEVVKMVVDTQGVNQINTYPNFDAILREADGIMIARGDLGAEIHYTEVPRVQRDLIRITHAARKSVIVATQMLQSMVSNKAPSRAEVTDVTYAIREGADSTMLSDETSLGIDPVQSVKTMREIADEALKEEKPLPEEAMPAGFAGRMLYKAIAHPVVECATKLDATLIVCFTDSGNTAIEIAHYRPQQPVIAITSKIATLIRLGLFRGIVPVLINYWPQNPTDHRQISESILKEKNLLQRGQRAVITLSMQRQPGKGKTDSLYVFEMS